MKIRCAQGRVRFVELGLILLIWAGGLCLPAAAVVGDEPNQEQALRARVGEFCSLLQAGRWTEAEAYVTQESKDGFRDWQRQRFLGFEVESVKLDAAGQEAQVTARVKTLFAVSPTPVPVPWMTRWRLVDGLWYLVAADSQRRDPPQLPNPDQIKSSRASSRPPEELKFKGHRYGLGIIQPGQVKVARFPFTNVTDHVVTLTGVLTGCECLRVKTEKKEYQPGESGELVIEFDSVGYKDQYNQTILVKTDPGGLTTRIRVHGYVAHRR